MEEEMIDELPVQLAHAASVNHDEMSLLKVVHGKNIP
jgi:hypothetical protein